MELPINQNKTMKKDCEKQGGDCEQGPDVACPFHGQDALKNKTGYYEVKCQTCDNSGFVRQNSKKFPVIKCPFCR